MKLFHHPPSIALWDNTVQYCILTVLSIPFGQFSSVNTLKTCLELVSSIFVICGVVICVSMSCFANAQSSSLII